MCVLTLPILFIICYFIVYNIYHTCAVYIFGAHYVYE